MAESQTARLWRKRVDKRTDLAPRLILMPTTLSHPIIAQHSRTYSSSIQTSRSPRCSVAPFDPGGPASAPIPATGVPDADTKDEDAEDGANDEVGGLVEVGDSKGGTADEGVPSALLLAVLEPPVVEMKLGAWKNGLDAPAARRALASGGLAKLRTDESCCVAVLSRDRR